MLRGVSPNFNASGQHGEAIDDDLNRRRNQIRHETKGCFSSLPCLVIKAPIMVLLIVWHPGVPILKSHGKSETTKELRGALPPWLNALCIRFMLRRRLL